jgi:DNA polymerase-3 subunit alpha
MLALVRDEPSRFWSLHTHSRYSATDAMPQVKEIVKRAKELGYPALGLTDHGNMAGSVELYRECRKAGIKPLPGSELYFVTSRDDKKAKRYHLCMAAYTTEGYRNMVRISTDTHRNFHYKPLLDFADLARYADEGWNEGIALTTGCYFGLVVQTLIHEGYEAAKQIVATYAMSFDTYVELQVHHIDHGEGVMPEAQIVDNLVAIADDLGLPCILTQDSHYVHEGEKPLHDAMKKLVSYGSDLDDVVFPGDGFHLVDDAWMMDHHAHYARGVAGLDLLLSKHDMYVPEIEEYQYRIPAVSVDPDKVLRQRCTKALARASLFTKKYLDRLDEELSVVEAAGMANYLLLVAQVCDYMRLQGIHYQTRGSAAGSLACWMLGITNLNPIKWGATFDRFLSKDRTKPPDIDLDVEHTRRRQVHTWIARRYAVTQVCTWGVLGMNKDERGKGSLKVKYFSKRRQVLKANGQRVPQDAWWEIPAEDRQEIFRLAAKECYSGYGVHACALALLTTQSEMDEMVPMQWVASSKTMVTQYDGSTIESLGIIKLDLLGSKTMTVLRKTADNLGREMDFLEEIPFDSLGVYSMLRRGDTDGVFQLEGGTSQRGCKDLKPKSIHDIVDSMALFRPATMNSGAMQTYLDRRFGREEQPKRHDLIQRHTKKTRGVLLYQDQIIQILRDLGLNPDDLTDFLKAVKASNKNVTEAKAKIDRYMPMIQRMCTEQGMTDEDWRWMDHAFRAFADYSFNVAHATVYGLCAYRCAYLALHHPIEFHAALLEVAGGTDKETQYIRATRGRGIRIRKPDLNGSKQGYAIHRKAIRKGFLAIDGLGPVIARHLERGQPYKSWDDFAAKAVGTKISGVKDFHPHETSPDQLVGTVRILYDLGVFADSIGDPPFGEGYVKPTRRKKAQA